MTELAETSRWEGSRQGAAGGSAPGALDGIPVERFVRGLFANLNARGVRYAVLRNYEGYPYALHKPDVSVLASDGDVKKLIAAFEALCDDLGCACVIHPGKRQSVVMLALWLGVDADGQPRAVEVQVDVRLYESFKLTRLQRSGLGVNYKVFMDRVRTRRVSLDGCEFDVLDEVDELIFLFKQWKRKNQESYRRRILEALRGDKARELFSAATGVTDPEGALPAAYEPRVDGMLRAMVRRRWGAHTPWRLAGTHVRAAMLWVRRHAAGPMVYYAGPDGCGKTTAVDAVKDLLRGRGIRYRYIYSFKRVLRAVMKRLGGLKKLIGGKRPAATAAAAGPGVTHVASNQDVVEEGDRDTGSSLWRMRKRVTLLIGLADIAIGYAMSLPYRWRGDVVLVETSPYDIFIKYHMPEFPVLERAVAPLLPKPARCVVLRATSESIFKRKPELSRQEIDEYYRRLDLVLDRARVRGRVTDVRSDNGRAASTVDVWGRTLAVIGRK